MIAYVIGLEGLLVGLALGAVVAVVVLRNTVVLPW